MTTTSDLLHLDISIFKEAPKWPAAPNNYRLIITGYVEGTHKATSARGIAFSARALSCVEAEDLANSELAAETNAKLEAYGDWTAKEHSWVYTDRETQKLHLMAFCPLNFLLLNEDGTPHKAASYFYVRDPQTGQESGFVHDVLGLSFPDGGEMGDVLEACVGQQFYGTFEYNINPKRPDSPPNLQLSEVSSA